MPGETKGLLPEAGVWSELSLAQIAFGQGLSVNALQMGTAVNALANEGEVVSPSLVRGRATTAAGNEVGTETTTRRRAVSERAAQADRRR